jgi:hypothetical protein
LYVISSHTQKNFADECQVADWTLLGMALGACVNLLNALPPHVFGALALDSTIDPLPTLDYDPIADSEYALYSDMQTNLFTFSSSSCYTTILPWLSNSAFDRAAIPIAQDLESHRNMGRGT